MRIEVLYFDGCPNHKPTLERVREALRKEDIEAEVSEVRIADHAAARAAGFLGSPSVRINGLDVEPAARSLTEFGMMCRTYTDQGKRVGTPPRELIRSALREAVGAPPAQDRRQTPAAAAPPSDPGVRNPKWMLGASLAAALAASLCCVLPILTAVAGVGVLAAGARFEPWRPYLLSVTGVLLGAGLALALRSDRKACAPGSMCVTRRLDRWSLAALGTLALLVAGLAAFPYYSGLVARAVLSNPSAAKAAPAGALATVAFRIPEMDCAACAAILHVRLKQLRGVADVTLDVDGRKAVVAYDPASQNVPALERVIGEAGFRVASTSFETNDAAVGGSKEN